MNVRMDGIWGGGMAVSGEAVAAVLQRDFGVSGALVPLPGEHDLNFRVTGQGVEYLLKLHVPGSDAGLLDLQVAVLDHLALAAPDLPLSRQIRADGRALVPVAGYQARLLSWLEGAVWAKATRTPVSFTSLGALFGRLDRALEGFVHPDARRDYGWDIGQADQHLPALPAVEDEKRPVVAAILTRFRDRVLPALATCPRQVIHNDANDYNVLLGADGAVSGLLDFGDMVESWRIVELAVACAYALIGSDDQVGAVLPLVAAYHAENPLSEAEVEVLFDLILTRYAISIMMASVQIRANPENRYLLVSQADVWRELTRLQGENPRLATLRLRDACGFAPVPGAAQVTRWLERNAHDFAFVLNRDPARVTRIDLSVASPDAAHLATLEDAGFDRWCEDVIAGAGADFAMGPYGEERGIYKGEAFAMAEGRRSTHIGIDLFAPAGEQVRAPFAGKVAFLLDDAVPYGFGPTVLLEHDADGVTFWTLYGHLERSSWALLLPGQAIAKGQPFAAFGARHENGNWPPHLHFQIVTDHLGLEGRMHGVGLARDWQIWREIAPDPSVILGLPVPAAVPVPRAPDWLARQRQRRIGRSLSVAYAPEALKIVGGEGCHLIDHHGQRWLDMVNNVAHVGHGHPRVVAAAQAQMARLNTNTRYLHDGLVEYADRLTALFPAPLSVAFFVNSGSEANDLAIRLARAATGNRDLITVDHAYHGHVSSLIDVSPYKFNGPGGQGRPPHVRIAELPDPYRGRLRQDDPGAGAGYAASVAAEIEALAQDGRCPALFFSEGVLGTGGQIVPPPGYLDAAYAHVRAAGGLCLADEVQVGFGRVGSHMWAFEAQGVVPDIVTLGKPIGNGHPMAAVITTPDIAHAFANGMAYFNTFGGNPVSAAIGLAVLDVIRDERLMHHCHVTGNRLMDGARALAALHPAIGDVRGLGLFIGIELVRDRATQDPDADLVDHVIREMKRRHRILLSSEGPLHNVLKIKPPAAFSAADCDRFLAALDGVLSGKP